MRTQKKYSFKDVIYSKENSPLISLANANCVLRDFALMILSFCGENSCRDHKRVNERGKREAFRFLQKIFLHNICQATFRTIIYKYRLQQLNLNRYLISFQRFISCLNIYSFFYIFFYRVSLIRYFNYYIQDEDVCKRSEGQRRNLRDLDTNLHGLSINVTCLA